MEGKESVFLCFPNSGYTEPKRDFFIIPTTENLVPTRVLNSKLRPIVLSVFDRSGRECIGLKTRSNLVKYTTDSIARFQTCGIGEQVCDLICTHDCLAFQIVAEIFDEAGLHIV